MHKVIGLSVTSLFVWLLFFSCASLNSPVERGGSSVEVIGRMLIGENQPARNLQFYVYYLGGNNSSWTTGSTNEKGEYFFTVTNTGTYKIEVYRETFDTLNASQYVPYATQVFIVETLGGTMDLGTLYLGSKGFISGELHISQLSELIYFSGQWNGNGFSGEFQGSVIKRNDSSFIAYHSDSVIPPGSFNVLINVYAAINQNQDSVDCFHIVDTTVLVPHSASIRLPAVFVSGQLSVEQQRLRTADSLAIISLQSKMENGWIDFDYSPQTGRISSLLIELPSRGNPGDIWTDLAKLSGLSQLRLKEMAFDTLPREVCSLANLVFLTIDNSSVSHVPSEFTNLDQLQFLDLSNNKFTQVPSVLLDDCWAPNFVVISMRGNAIALDSETQQRLREHLYAKSGNTYVLRKQFIDLYPYLSLTDYDVMKKICSLNAIPPSEISSLFSTDESRILTINISDKYCISKIPDEIETLEKLFAIEIGRNSLDSLPVALAMCQALIAIKFPNGTIASIPPAFGDLVRLKDLDVNNNCIAAVPSWISKPYELIKEPSHAWYDKSEFRADFSCNRIPPSEINSVIRMNCFAFYPKQTCSPTGFDLRDDLNTFDWSWGLRNIWRKDDRVVMLTMDLIRFFSSDYSLSDRFDRLAGFDSLKGLVFTSEIQYSVPRTFNSFPQVTTRFNSLEDLVFNTCDIDTLPSNLVTMFPNIKRISLRNCSFTSVPAILKNMPGLEYVDLYYNKLTAVSEEDRQWLDAHCREHQGAVYISAERGPGFSGKTWDQTQRQ